MVRTYALFIVLGPDIFVRLGLVSPVRSSLSVLGVSEGLEPGPDDRERLGRTRLSTVVEGGRSRGRLHVS